MKKYLLLTAMALTLAAPGTAWCQSHSGGNGYQGGGVQQGGQGDEKQRFEEHKAEILKRIGERLAEVEQRQRCVEAANDHEALLACMPQRERGERHGGGGERSGGGEEHSGGGEEHGGDE